MLFKKLIQNWLLSSFFAIAILLLNLSSGLTVDTKLATTIPKAERAVLFYFDGLHPDAIAQRLGRAESARFDLPNLKRLQAEGTTVETAIMTFPWHPTTGAYGEDAYYFFAQSHYNDG